MPDPDIASQLAGLFRNTSDAHHDAFRDTNGDDPEWPIWYADYLFASIRKLTKLKFTKSELIGFLVIVDEDYRQKSPQTEWAQYYAEAFLRTFKS